MSATALIKFTQGATVGGDGQALFGVTGTAVNVANVSNAGVASWEIEVLHAPLGSAVVVGILAFSENGSAPAASFTADVRGPYRLRLRVWEGQNRSGDPKDTDIRCFGVKEENGFYRPAPEIWPRPLPPIASGEVGCKPDENNFGGQAFGYAGDGTDGLLGSLIAHVLQNADWVLGRLRIFAVDPINGDDSRKGYADAAGTTAGDYATACVAAGAVARKTIAGLVPIVPKFGNGRQAEIILGNGGVSAGVSLENLYADSLALIVSGCTGYASGGLVVRGTGTNATAGAVAFDGTANDLDYQGAITATGCNAAGYTPIGTPTTTLVQLQKFGGGAAAIPVDPAKPLGYRIRFDNGAGVNPLLRNVSRQVHQIVGTDSFVPQTPLPAAPGAGDTCYFEQPGVAIPALTVTSLGPSVAVISGIRSTGTVNQINSNIRWVFCGGNAFTSSGLSVTITAQTLTHPALSTRTVGGGFRSETSASATAILQLTAVGLVSITTTTLTSLPAVTWGAGCYAGGLTLAGCQLTGASIAVTNPSVGVPGSTAVGAPRIVGSPLRFRGAKVLVGKLDISNVAGVGAMLLDGGANEITVDGVISGTGNGAGCYLEQAGAPARASRLILLATPTVTGTSGDLIVHGASGIAITWAQAAATGIADNAGNRIFGLNGAPPLTPSHFAGSLQGGVGAVFSYPGMAFGGGNQTTALRRPCSQGIWMRLRLNVLTNTFTGPLTATIYKNNVATTLVITVPAPAGVGATGKFVDTTHPVLVADDDDWDVRYDAAAADPGASANISGCLERAA